ncbi:MAG: pyruvate:ferredoxin (flavodoxin) oxidoreductase, partial [Acidobacteria bacterium]
GGLDHALASGQDINVLVLDTEVYSNTGGQRSKSTFMGAVAKFAALGKEVQKKDLGMMAMSYGNVYVASVSFGANMNQTLKAMREAASYPGSSIIIAYSNCIEHGFNMEKGPEHAKLAVDSGYWMLYRYNPLLAAEKKNPLQIDSKEPTKSLKDFYAGQRRFKTLMETHPEIAENYLEDASRFVRNRYRYYKHLAEMSYEDFEA